MIALKLTIDEACYELKALAELIYKIIGQIAATYSSQYTLFTIELVHDEKHIRSLKLALFYSSHDNMTVS